MPFSFSFFMLSFSFLFLLTFFYFFINIFFLLFINIFPSLTCFPFYFLYVSVYFFSLFFFLLMTCIIGIVYVKGLLNGTARGGTSELFIVYWCDTVSSKLLWTCLDEVFGNLEWEEIMIKIGA